MAEIPVVIEGKPIQIEVAGNYGSQDTSTRSGTNAIERAQNAFENAKESIFAICQSVVQTIDKVDDAITPDEFTLEFGIKFKVDGSVLLAAVSSEATLTVKMVYKHKRAKVGGD